MMRRGFFSQSIFEPHPNFERSGLESNFVINYANYFMHKYEIGIGSVDSLHDLIADLALRNPSQSTEIVLKAIDESEETKASQNGDAFVDLATNLLGAFSIVMFSI